MNLRRLGSVPGTTLAWAIFFALSAAIYFQALNGGFIFDDMTYIINAPLIHSSDALFKIWFSKESQDYWPLTYSLFRAEWFAFGMDSLGYHLVNLSLHALSCALLWRILLRLRLPYPFLIALLFCVHPANVESVAWIFQTKTTLSAALVLAATLLYLRGNPLLALTFFVSANLAKISVVTWPVVFLGYEWYRAGYRMKREALKRLAPFFAASLALGGLNLFWYASVTAPETAPHLDALTRLAAFGQIVGFYLYKSLLPFHLNLIYRRWAIDTSSWLAWVPSLVLAGALAFLALNRRRRHGAVMLAVLYFLATLFPVLGLVQFHYVAFSWVADHYLYLSLAGLITACVYFGSLAVRSRQAKVAVVCVLSVLYVSLTMMRASDYSDGETIWRDTLAKNPDAWVAHHNLGVILNAEGKTDEAVQEFNSALQIKPDHADAQYGLGVALYSKGRFHEAAEHFEATVRLDPARAEAHNNLGVTLAQLSQTEDAVNQFVDAIKLKPDYEEARRNLTALNPGLARKLASSNLGGN